VDVLPKTVIDVFADVACPFTHVGLKSFLARRAALRRDDVILRVRAWPLEIVNGQPLDPSDVAEEIDALHDQIGSKLFTGFTQESFPATSIPALALASAAYELDLMIGERVSLQLRDMLFEQGVPIADADVLHEVAAEHGIDVDLFDGRPAIAEHAQGVRRGVIGSPHFFTPAGGFFCPALDVSRDAGGHLIVRADNEDFERFLATCFGEPSD
jgi:2-hydroxychromene-2-carboxylate isomerase